MGKSETCRLCLCKSEETTYEDDEKSQLLSQVREIFGFEVNTESELICVYCKERVNSFYSYFRSVLDNQFKLQGIGLTENKDDGRGTANDSSEESECDVKASAFSEMMLKTELTEEETPLISRKSKKRKKSRHRDEELDEEAEKRQKEDERIAKYISFKCMLCPNDSINDLTNWKMHMRRVHDETRPVIVCCDRKLTDRRRILYHIGFHHETEAEFECDKCSKKFKLKAYLLSHMKTHEINTTKNFQCDKCPEKFLYRGHLTKHQLIHMTPEEQALVKFYPCKQCDKEFPSAKNLGSHVRRVHKKLSTFVCHICAKVFSKKERLTSHFLYKHTDNPPKHQCEHCGIELANNDTYRYHVKLQHTSAGSYPCNYCGKVNATEVQLKAHIRFTHETERKHQCEYCPKAFKRAVDLTEHLSIHMGGALYDCPTCDRKFNSKSNMQSHVKKCKMQTMPPTTTEMEMQ